jgi:hypothetical protein
MFSAGRSLCATAGVATASNPNMARKRGRMHSTRELIFRVRIQIIIALPPFQWLWFRGSVPRFRSGLCDLVCGRLDRRTKLLKCNGSYAFDRARNFFSASGQPRAQCVTNGAQPLYHGLPVHPVG